LGYLTFDQDKAAEVVSRLALDSGKAQHWRKWKWNKSRYGTLLVPFEV
jgi:hypothetical protein